MGNSLGLLLVTKWEYEARQFCFVPLAEGFARGLLIMYYGSQMVLKLDFLSYAMGIRQEGGCLMEKQDTVHGEVGTAQPLDEVLATAMVDWERLPVFVEGRSIEIRQVSEELGICRFKPICYSSQSPRQGSIPGTGELRMKIHALLTRWLKTQGVDSTYLVFSQGFALVKLVRVPPIEVIVKAALVGTPLMFYRDIDAVPTRFGSFLRRGMRHEPYVRFDWRNRYPEKDQVMPVALADYFIDTAQAEKTALQAFGLLRQLFGRLSLELQDMVFTMDEQGLRLTSEISPEAVRLKRKADGVSYDADLWRRGEAPEVIVERLTELSELLTAMLDR